jgi:hypothetical protein
MTVIGLLTHKLLLLAVSLAGLAFLYQSEDDLRSALFAFMIFCCLALSLMALTRRVAVSIYGAWGVAGILTLVSIAKAKMVGMSLHSFDVLFVMQDIATPLFLLQAYPVYAALVLAGLGLAFAVVLTIGYWEKPLASSRSKALFLLALSGVGSAALQPPWAEGTDYYYHGRHLSSFTVSVRDLGRLWAGHPLEARITDATRLPPYGSPYRCGDSTTRPDIVLIHAESQLPPSMVPHWGVSDQAVGLKPDPAHVRRFGVETFGGSSWVTTASIMTGLSGADFAWQRPFMMKSVIDTTGATVPRILSDCGYLVAGVVSYDIFDVGRFMRANGAVDVIEGSVGTPSGHFARDRQYFASGQDLLTRFRGASDAPAFVYIETMYTHSPYDQKVDSDVILENEPFHPDPAIAEYLRRLAISRMDIDAFKLWLAQNPGDRGTVVIEYGDHRPWVSLDARFELSEQLADWASSAYETYLSVETFGPVAMPSLPDEPRMDAAYLGYWFIQALSVASGGIVDDMEKLRVNCAGIFHLCHDRAAVDRLLRKRVDSGLLELVPMRRQWFSPQGAAAES